MIGKHCSALFYIKVELNQCQHNFLDILTQPLSFFHRVSLAIDANDGLGVALAQVGPTILKVNLDTIYSGHLLALIMLLYCTKDGINIHPGLEFEFSLCNAVLRIGLLQLADGHAALGQQREEQRHAHKRITAIVAGGINHATIALTADDCTSAAHLGGNIDLTDRGSSVTATMLEGNVTQARDDERLLTVEPGVCAST